MQINKQILSINSHIKYLGKVDNFLKSLFKDWEINDKLYNPVYLCVSEAVTNSIIHGNKNDINKTIIIEIISEGDFLKFTIIDEGSGFNFNQIPDPTTSINVKKEKGRGLYIIKSITDDIQFKNNGSVIEFKIRLSETDRLLSGKYSSIKN